MSRWQPYNPNPRARRTTDCTIRAICKAMGQDWETTYSEIAEVGRHKADMMESDHVWGAYLTENGFRRYVVDSMGRDDYTVEDFCWDHPYGTYILCPSGHVVCVVDGRYYDVWDSGDEVPIYYYAR